jgi:hypothetical protein
MSQDLAMGLLELKRDEVFDAVRGRVDKGDDPL